MGLTGPFTVEAHATREDWLAARKLGIGSSESAAVIGVSAWKSRFSLWAEKTGEIESPDVQSEAARWGLIHEDNIAAEYERRTGRKLSRAGETPYTITRSIACPHMFATHDRIIEPIDERGPGILSIKTADKSKRDQWLTGDTVAPLDYQAQLQHELSVSNCKWGAFAVLIGGNEFLEFDVERNDEFIAFLEREEFEFWRSVQHGQRPDVDGSESTAATLYKLYPKENEAAEVILPDEAVMWDQARISADKVIKEAEERKRLAENCIKAAIGDGAVGILPGGIRYTYRTRTRAPSTSRGSTWRELKRQHSK